MAEYIEREAAYADFENCNAENPKWTPNRVKALIARQPSFDVSPVVRCKKCIHGGNCSLEDTFRFVGGIENPFCCVGTTKEGAENG